MTYGTVEPVKDHLVRNTVVIALISGIILFILFKVLE